MKKLNPKKGLPLPHTQAYRKGVHFGVVTLDFQTFDLSKHP